MSVLAASCSYTSLGYLDVRFLLGQPPFTRVTSSLYYITSVWKTQGFHFPAWALADVHLLSEDKQAIFRACANIKTTVGIKAQNKGEIDGHQRGLNHPNFVLPWEPVGETSQGFAVRTNAPPLLYWLWDFTELFLPLWISFPSIHKTSVAESPHEPELLCGEYYRPKPNSWHAGGNP